MRADRLVSILLWLQVHGQTSTTALAKRLEVSPRTILRDMDALSTSGIPVYALRGRSGGWALPEEYRLSSKWLSTEEVKALAVLTPAHVLADLGIAGAADTAWLKLLAALPPMHRDDAAFVQARIHVDTRAWQPRRERAEWLPALKAAVFAERLVTIRYQRAEGEAFERTVAPLGLVAKGHIWYLVALAEGEFRTYRVSRIASVDCTSDRFQRPPSFDLPAFWEASKVRLAEGLPRYPAVVRIPAETIEAFRGTLRWARIERIDPADDDGWCRMSVIFETTEYARIAVLGFGDRIEAIDPPELREDVARSVHAMYARHCLGTRQSSGSWDGQADVAGVASDSTPNGSRARTLT